LFAADFAVGSFSISGLQNRIGQMLKYSNKWNLQCNMNKTTDTEKEENRKAENVGIVCMVQDWWY